MATGTQLGRPQCKFQGDPRPTSNGQAPPACRQPATSPSSIYSLVSCLNYKAPALCQAPELQRQLGHPVVTPMVLAVCLRVGH